MVIPATGTRAMASRTRSGVSPTVTTSSRSPGSTSSATGPTPASRSFSVASSGPTGPDRFAPARGAERAATWRSPSRAPSRTPRSSAASHPSAPPYRTGTPAIRPRVPGYFGLADGSWSFEVRARDPQTQAWSAPPAEWLVQVDNAGPAFLVADRPIESDVVARRRLPVRAVGGGRRSDLVSAQRRADARLLPRHVLRYGGKERRTYAAHHVRRMRSATSGSRTWCGSSTSVPRGSGSPERPSGSRPRSSADFQLMDEDRPGVVPVLVRRIGP